VPAETAQRERFFFVRGLWEHHLDPLESALRRRDLAVAAESESGRPLLVGSVNESETVVWEALCHCGRARAEPLAAAIGYGQEHVDLLLEALFVKRLLLRDDRVGGPTKSPEFVSFEQAFMEAERRRGDRPA